MKGRHVFVRSIKRNFCNARHGFPQILWIQIALGCQNQQCCLHRITDNFSTSQMGIVAKAEAPQHRIKIREFETVIQDDPPACGIALAFYLKRCAQA